MMDNPLRAACAPADLDTATKLERLYAAAVEACWKAPSDRGLILTRAGLYALDMLHAGDGVPFREARKRAGRFRRAIKAEVLAGPPGAQEKWVR